MFTNTTAAGYTNGMPEPVGKLLQNLEFTLAMENEIMGAILDDGEEPEDEAAAAWLKKPIRAYLQAVARRRDDARTVQPMALQR